MVASTANAKTLVNQRGNIPIFRTNTNKILKEKRKEKQKQNKNNRFKSSFNFSLWLLRGQNFFFL